VRLLFFFEFEGSGDPFQPRMRVRSEREARGLKKINRVHLKVR
jgi:hypothetical protein